MRDMKNFLSSIICLTILSSCKQELCDWESLNDSYTVKFSVDWSMSNIDLSDIHNLSVYAYPEDGGAPYIRVSGDITSGYINIPSGVYSLLIFNDVVGDIAGINFVDINSLADFRAEIIEQSGSSNLYYSIEEGELLATPHEQLAVWQMDSFEVTQNLVVCPYCEEVHNEEVSLSVMPTPLTVECIFSITIENLNNAQIIQGVLKGFASGAYLDTQERFSTPNVTNLYSVIFTSRTYDSSENIDGVVNAEITTFGKSPSEEQTYELEIDIILNSGEKVTYTRDITEQIKTQNSSVITINLDSTDNLISLPASTGTGFEVEGWGDRESIELL